MLTTIVFTPFHENSYKKSLFEKLRQSLTVTLEFGANLLIGNFRAGSMLIDAVLVTSTGNVFIFEFKNNNVNQDTVIINQEWRYADGTNLTREKKNSNPWMEVCSRRNLLYSFIKQFHNDCIKTVILFSNPINVQIGETPLRLEGHKWFFVSDFDHLNETIVANNSYPWTFGLHNIARDIQNFFLRRHDSYMSKTNPARYYWRKSAEYIRKIFYTINIVVFGRYQACK